MHKLLRLYNQNRTKIWIIIIIIAFILFIIQTLNNIAKQENTEEKNNENQETTYNNVVSYDKESEAIISNKKISKEEKVKNGKIIDDFFTNCINHNPEQAYELLSSDIKNKMYQSQSLFESLYYNKRFEGDKQYSFQLWISDNNQDTYLVKVYDNMLSTGKSNSTYIEDYVTVIQENGKAVLNINSYIGKTQINKIQKTEKLTAQITERYTYKDYEIFEIVVKNNTNEKILLDTLEKSGTIYITDSKENKYQAFLNENTEEELTINANQTKSIQIKFNIVKREDLKLKNIKFTNIVTNYDKYLNNQEDKNIINMQIDF